MIKLAFAIGFLSVFGFVAYSIVVFLSSKYFKEDKKEEPKKQ